VTPPPGGGSSSEASQLAGIEHLLAIAREQSARAVTRPFPRCEDAVPADQMTLLEEPPSLPAGRSPLIPLSRIPLVRLLKKEK
jgi:hypothetical protein